MRRFFIDGPLAERVTVSGGDARHITKVLRLQPGTDIIVTDKDGQAAVAKIIAIEPDAVTAIVEHIIEQHNEPPVEIRLAQGLTKADKFDYIVQKAVELGAAGVIPMAADFCVVRYDAAKAAAKVERWQKIAREAAKQCGRSLVPQVGPLRELGEILAEAGPDTTVIMLYEGAGGQSLKTILSEARTPKYLLLIGPEGGFSQAETKFCADNGVRIATMGRRILRTETAAVAALAVVMYDKGDLGGQTYTLT